MSNLNETLENLRGNYQGAKFDIEDCNPDPELQFDFWLQNALNAKCDEPNAFVLSTVTASGKPRARVLLLKGIHNGKFVFYTNYKSSKGDEMETNSRVALTFLWLPLQRQVRIEGVVTKLSIEASEEYFKKRPRGSQLGAIASPQSKKVASRAELERLFKEAAEKFEEATILPRPPHWGGYAVSPDYLEFWQGRANRMHDRICYEKTDAGWALFRLAP
ncbi:MAG TPA: pyridoxamine 5'-phosphate oxidase [Bacteriovoracaceae bacterium]|nr:pyridoxamine 5'-phosphate oxidase [Bacteriovoracaceae bacterium]